MLDACVHTMIYFNRDISKSSLLVLLHSIVTLNYMLRNIDTIMQKASKKGKTQIECKNKQLGLRIELVTRSFQTKHPISLTIQVISVVSHIQYFLYHISLFYWIYYDFMLLFIYTVEFGEDKNTLGLGPIEKGCRPAKQLGPHMYMGRG